MAWTKGGPRKGAGRKPTGNVPMLVRVSPAVRASLEREVEREGGSLSAAAERAIGAAAKAFGADQQTKALCYLINQLVVIGKTLEQTTDRELTEADLEPAPALGPPAAKRVEFNWRTIRFDFEAFRSAVIQVIDRLAPAGDAGRSRYVLAGDPEGVGRTMASMVIGLLSTPRAEHNIMGQARGAPLFYAYPQAARDLNLTREHVS
jgi:hypothetical protein